VSPAAFQSLVSLVFSLVLWHLGYGNARLPIYPAINSTDCSQFSMLPHALCFWHRSSVVALPPTPFIFLISIALRLKLG